ncbi:TlpA family protein disulfide reductase [Ramlibacter sp. GTP1]|uniref:TlpA family protein disulfide reductase n=2 Tax=Ramlibacter albus TaxID=2079448 RepID=A0A923MBT5_9BURK|nr:TlpA family protein disulfide reductase [Ramlibacter albus]
MHVCHARRALLAYPLSVAVSAAMAQQGAQVRAWPAGRAAPAFDVTDLQGRRWSAPGAGKALAVNFWATWCEPCRSEMPTLQQLSEFYADKLAVVALNFKERAATAQRFARQGGFDLPIALDPDGDVAKRWEVKVFPTTILIDAAGRPRWRVQGEMDWTGKEALALVEGLWR